MAVTKEAVAKLYVAFFDRAPDAAGLEYWVSTGLSLEEISQSFFDQDETKEKYPDTLTTAQFINTIYNNLFGRDADDEGLVYWAKEIDSGNIPRSKMILAVVNGAKDTDLGKDKTILENKTEVALDFADSGLNDLEKAVSIMEDVTADPATVEDAKTQIQLWDDALHSFSLTSGKDTIEGTDGDDTISGTVTNFQSGDTLDGKDGYDVLKITGVTGSTEQATVKNIEKLVLDVTGASKINFADFDTSIETINITASNDVVLGSDGKASTTNDMIDNIIESLKINLSATAIVELDYSTNTVSGTEDVQKFIVDSNNDTTVKADGIEKFEATINKASTAKLTITSDSLKDVVIDGEGGLKDLSLSKLIDKIDLSNMKGSLGVPGATPTPVKTSSINAKNITTGDAKDAVEVDSTDTKTLVTNDGDDYVKLSTSNITTLDVGNGNNVIDLASVAKAVNAGKGNDTVTVSATTADIDTLYLGNGDNTLTYTAAGKVAKIYSGDGSDNISIAKGTTEVKTGDGSDTIKFYDKTINTDGLIIDGGNGTDKLDISIYDASSLDLSASKLSGIETIDAVTKDIKTLTLKVDSGVTKLDNFKSGGSEKVVFINDTAWVQVFNPNDVDSDGEFYFEDDAAGKSSKIQYFYEGDVHTLSITNESATGSDSVKVDANMTDHLEITLA